MATLADIKADDKNCFRSQNNTDDCIIKTGYCKFKRFCDIVKILIGYAHTPYKVVNIGNVLLPVLFCYHDDTSPQSTTVNHNHQSIYSEVGLLSVT